MSSALTASAQITNRWLHAPPIIQEKSNAVGGGSPPNSDAFRRQSEIASSVSRSSPIGWASRLPASCAQALARFHGFVTYQPAGRYWAFQGIETGIFAALAATLLTVTAVLLLRRDA